MSTERASQLKLNNQKAAGCGFKICNVRTSLRTLSSRKVAPRNAKKGPEKPIANVKKQTQTHRGAMTKRTKLCNQAQLCILLAEHS